MALDFNKIRNRDKGSKILSPRDIFMSLPNKSEKYLYPRDVQTEVWNSWFSKRNKKDLIIKMNTGSGKTVVGLLILKSCIEEGKGPAVYVVPDSYLIKQVMDEAERLGLNVTDNADSVDVIRNKAILVINIQKLVNGKSIFGLRDSNNIPINSILIDDVHACISTTNNQFTLRISNNTDLYNELMPLFNEALKQQSENEWLNLTFNEPTTMLLPFWCWQDNISKIIEILHKHKNDKNLLFKYDLIKDCLPYCDCICSNSYIEITPKSIPISKIESFENAERRIFMSATLADDSPFLSHFNIKYENNDIVITPQNADDIGERMILIPEAINNSVTQEDEKSNLVRLSKKYNTVVIVPSEKRALFWKDVADEIVLSDNIEDSVNRLRNQHIGLVVFINKYEGIDLPNDACRILAIDGISEVKNGIDIIERNVLANSSRMQNSIIQKIEQGMGRGIRSNQDYCLVFLLGKNLTKLLYVDNAIDKFSIATKKQLQLSDEISEQLRNKSVNEIFDAGCEYCLERNKDWIEISKSNLIDTQYDNKLNIDSVTKACREAFDLAENREYEGCINILEKEANSTDESIIKGWIKQQIAEYTNFLDKDKAQQILLSANKLNKRVLKPLRGIQIDRHLNKYSTQAKELTEYINNSLLNQNKYIITINSVLESLKYEENTSSNFEEAFKELAFLIGYKGYRPEKDYGIGPDNLWQIDDNYYFVVECKNGVTNKTICKHDCNQLNGSIEWFKNNYGIYDKKYTPIMIHIGNQFEYAASPNSDIRIITPSKLELLKKRVREFAYAFVQDDNFTKLNNITVLLDKSKLSKSYFVSEYTSNFKINKK